MQEHNTIEFLKNIKALAIELNRINSYIEYLDFQNKKDLKFELAQIMCFDYELEKFLHSNKAISQVKKKFPELDFENEENVVSNRIPIDIEESLNLIGYILSDLKKSRLIINNELVSSVKYQIDLVESFHTKLLLLKIIGN